MDIVFIVLNTYYFYWKAKKVGVSKLRWAVVGFFMAAIPLILLPVILNIIAGKDVGGIGIMAAIATIIVLNGILIKKVR
jgi:hypothetical protein